MMEGENDYQQENPLKGEEPKEWQFVICGYDKSKSKFSPLTFKQKDTNDCISQDPS